MTKPVIFGIAGLGLVAILVFVGKGFLQKRSDKPDTHVEQAKELAGLAPNSDTAALAELLFDTLDYDDGIYDVADTVSLPISTLVNAVVDSNEYVEIPGEDYLDNHALLNGIVTGDEVELDESGEFDLMLAGSMRQGIEDFDFTMGNKAKDSLKPAIIDTAAIVAAFKPQIVGDSKFEIDSLRAVASMKEQNLQMLAANNQELSEKLVRYKPRIDSTRAVQVKRLVKIIETMSPSAAAGMLASQTTDEITEILFKVKPRKAAQILQQLPPAVAADVTVRVVRQ